MIAQIRKIHSFAISSLCYSGIWVKVGVRVRVKSIVRVRVRVTCDCSNSQNTLICDIIIVL